MERKISIIGLVVNLVLGIVKLIVGILSKSSAIIAEGLHSGMDVISSAINYIGIKASKKPADKEHPYGYYKAEVLSGFIITIILFLTGVWIVYKAVISFLEPKELVVTSLSVGIMALSAIVNLIMSQIKIRYGKKYNSISLLSDGAHSRVDVLTSIAVLIGLIISKYFINADATMALLIGIYILFQSFSLGKKATDSLLDVSASEEIENKIKKVTEAENVKIEDLKTQKRGSKINAELKVMLANNLKVEEASAITKKLEEKLTQDIKNLEYVTIQISSHDFSESYYKDIFGRGLGWHGKGRMHGQALGPGGNCVCPKCGYKMKHDRRIPCSSLKCPNCNIQMTRGL